MHRDHELIGGQDSPDTESLLSEDLHPSEKQLLRPELSARSRLNRHVKTWLHAVAIVWYTAMTIALYTWSIRLRAAHKCACETGMISSPAQKAVEYETLTITHNLDNSTSKYRGEPSPTIDAAWDELLQYNNIRVSSAELLAANLTSVALHDTPSSDSHLVTLDVYHTLHCVNRARKALYPAYYTSPNRPEVDRAHVEHCLDLLRQVLMCHGDVALHTYQWRDDVRVPWPTFATTHQCTRWDRIVDWSRGRSVESLEGSILQHPTLGVSYPVDEKRRAQGNEE